MMIIINNQSLGCLAACRLVAGHLVACHLVAWSFGREVIWSQGLRSYGRRVNWLQDHLVARSFGREHLVASAWSWVI
jgi:hypothetical protein